MYRISSHISRILRSQSEPKTLIKTEIFPHHFCVVTITWIHFPVFAWNPALWEKVCHSTFLCWTRMGNMYHIVWITMNKEYVHVINEVYTPRQASLMTCDLFMLAVYYHHLFCMAGCVPVITHWLHTKSVNHDHTWPHLGSNDSCLCHEILHLTPCLATTVRWWSQE